MEKISEKMPYSKKYGYKYKEPQGVAIINNSIKQPEYESEILIGDGIRIYANRRFNWFQRFMMKLCFGFIVKNLKA